MTTRPPSDSKRYRLIITRRDASELLLSAQTAGWSLPRVEVPANRRPAQRLVAGVKAAYGFRTCCLLISGLPKDRLGESSAGSAVLEVLPTDDAIPAHARWLSLNAAKSPGALPAHDQAALTSSLDEIDGYIANPETGPFARPAWIQELFDWVQQRIEPLARRLTGDFDQLNASPTFSLLRMETTSAAVWFKATGEPNRHELPITAALHQFFPAYIPRILGLRPGWNGWLSEEAPGTTLEGWEDVRPWSQAASALAELQVTSIAKVHELLRSGCRDLRLVALIDQVDPFLSRMAELMEAQPKQPPKILNRCELRLLGDSLRAALYELESHRIPAALGHLDCNLGNILVSPARCTFLDWAEGCVTHPILTFEYLREHARRTFLHDPAAIGKIIRAYVGPWRSLFPPETLRKAMTFTPLVAVFVFAVAGQRWLSPDTLENPQLAGYFRSLTRRAFHEATQLTARSERCLT